MEEGRSAFKMLTCKSKGERHLGKSRRRWEDNIRMGPKEIRTNARNRVVSTQDRNYWRALANAT